MTTYRVTDALPAGDLLLGLGAVRSLLDRAGTVQVDDEGITLRGLIPRRVEWSALRSISIASRFDTAVGLGLGLLPVTRIPGVQSITERTVDRALGALTPALYRRARELAGWAVVRLELSDDEVEVRRLPALVVHLYPAVTRDIERRAAARGIPIERVRRLG